MRRRSCARGRIPSTRRGSRRWRTRRHAPGDRTRQRTAPRAGSGTLPTPVRSSPAFRGSRWRTQPWPSSGRRPRSCVVCARTADFSRAQRTDASPTTNHVPDRRIERLVLPTSSAVVGRRRTGVSSQPAPAMNRVGASVGLLCGVVETSRGGRGRRRGPYLPRPRSPDLAAVSAAVHNRRVPHSVDSVLGHALAVVSAGVRSNVTSSSRVAARSVRARRTGRGDARSRSPATGAATQRGRRASSNRNHPAATAAAADRMTR